VTTFLLVVHALIALALVTVILLQRSEGGGLGIGGGTGGGMVSVRGAANLLTRATTVLAVLFIGTSILLAVLAAGTSKPRAVDTSLASEGAPMATPGDDAPVDAPLPALPGGPGTGLLPPTPAPASAPADSVPLAQ
jgi:preprotein translocase subunit SecG